MKKIFLNKRKRIKILFLKLANANVLRKINQTLELGKNFPGAKTSKSHPY